MLSKKSLMRPMISAVAVTGCIITGFAVKSWAQNNPGFTLWSGVARENQLNYYLDYGGQPNGWDRYRFKIPAKKLELGVAQIAISYPDYFDGKFDPKRVEVRVKGKKVPISEVNWNKENHVIQIQLDQAIQAGNSIEIVFSNVKNPPFGGMYYFNAQVMTPGDIPLPRYVGTWILSIGG
ncbi:DUF2808 domain-containing protein [Allocoleopsis franciscana]|uniref:DUF2808 domain-containing protein n=1 Tax=Allocoleopsis franciscana PCC 7113 TaxID=1173027 RepID=K9WMA8_9CYAN|nr:DUF2808 domain-containing protein [Allocoleopsis franciscana]AFZ21540.1 Protein of unknown function (DUF2808) [Allocoleopsis franciscana PCC 7113]